MHCVSNPATSLSSLLIPSHLLTISDGSDDSGSMTFGWIIALPRGRRLARCVGPAFGPSGSSFQAEG
jgi:hypothetical protein